MNKSQSDLVTVTSPVCKHCGGTGGVTYTDDPSPPGISLPPGHYTYFEPCYYCFENGRCPQCAEKTLDSDELNTATCTDCGWKFGE